MLVRKLKNFKYFNLFFIFLISFLGIFLRFALWENFKIYKDSFKFLLIAKSTANFAVPSNYFPQYADFSNYGFVQPYKWLYSYVVGLITKVISILGIPLNNSTFENIAHLVVIFSGILTIILLYVFIYKVTNRRIAAVAGSLLLALSGIHIIWSGFIISDSFASLLLLIYLFLRYKRSNLIMILFSTFLLYLARAELVIIPVIIEILLFILKISKKHKKQSLLLYSTNLIFAVTFAFTCIKSNLITRNIQADILLWILVLMGTIIFLIPKFKKKLSENELKVVSMILLTISALLTIYYWFNPEISRYIITFIPLFALISSIVFLKIYDLLKKDIYRYFLIVFFLSSLFINIFYLSSFKKPEAIEYQTEVAKIVLQYAKNNSYKNIYVGQEEPFLWEDQLMEFNIIPIDKIQPSKILSKSLFVNDNSVEFSNSDFKFTMDQQKDFTKLFSSTTKAPFRVNNIIESGWFELWVKN